MPEETRVDSKRLPQGSAMGGRGVSYKVYFEAVVLGHGVIRDKCPRLGRQVLGDSHCFAMVTVYEATVPKMLPS